MYRILGLLAAILLACDFADLNAAEPVPRITFGRPRRKLIVYGWELGFREVSDLSRQASVIQRQPFDGIMFSLFHKGQGRDEAFIHSTRLTDKQFAEPTQLLSRIRWTSFTDNFLVVKAGERYLDDGPPPRMDWFDDKQWETICHNIQVMTRIARAGGCVGLSFDPEPYHATVWNYDTIGSRKAQPRRGSKSFADYRTMVRRRGAQYMQAIQSQMPRVRIFNLYQAVRIPPSQLAEAIYSLYPAFINGMLEAAGPEVRLIDGNEYGFSLLTRADFSNAYVNVKQRKQVLIDPSNRARYRAQVQVSVPIYLDDLFGSHKHRRWIGTYLSPDDKRRLFEHKLYQAMDSVDEYVWIYGERPGWFSSPPRVPRWASDSVRSVRKQIETLRLQARKDNKELIDRVRHHMARRDRELKTLTRAEQAEPRLTELSADIPAIPAQIKPPVIDGSLDDAAWKTAALLENFHPLLYLVRDRSEVTTRCRVTWDDRFLYTGWECREPRISELVKQPAETRRRNRTTLVLSNSPLATSFTRIDVPWDASPGRLTRPAGKPWTNVAGSPASLKRSFQSNATGWTAEWRVAWKLLGGAPEPNETRKATLTRIRSPWTEHDSWAPQIDPNLIDGRLLGSWTFTSRARDHGSRPEERPER